jgi:uncharacterized membrane protein YkoI
MKPSTPLLALALAVGPIAMATTAEKRIERKDLPSAVEKTVAVESGGASIRGFSREVEDGKTLYEVALTVDGRGRDVSIDSQGHVVEVEQEVSLSALPPAVREGLEKAAGSGHIVKVESLTKTGTLVAYEAAVRSGSKKSEVQVGPDGKPLAHPE